MFSLICAWINGWVNNHEAGNWRRYRAHYDVIVMISNFWCKTFDVSMLAVPYDALFNSPSIYFWYNPGLICEWIVNLPHSLISFVLCRYFRVTFVSNTGLWMCACSRVALNYRSRVWMCSVQLVKSNLGKINLIWSCFTVHPNIVEINWIELLIAKNEIQNWYCDIDQKATCLTCGKTVCLISVYYCLSYFAWLVVFSFYAELRNFSNFVSTISLKYSNDTF